MLSSRFLQFCESLESLVERQHGAYLSAFFDTLAEFFSGFVSSLKLFLFDSID